MNALEIYTVMVAEEASEVAQAACKCLRFTHSHQHKEYDSSNVQRLQDEMGDLIASLQLMMHTLTEDDAWLDANDAVRARMIKKLNSVLVSHEVGAI